MDEFSYSPGPLAPRGGWVLPFGQNNLVISAPGDLTTGPENVGAVSHSVESAGIDANGNWDLIVRFTVSVGEADFYFSIEDATSDNYAILSFFGDGSDGSYNVAGNLDGEEILGSGTITPGVENEVRLHRTANDLFQVKVNGVVKAATALGIGSSIWAISRLTIDASAGGTIVIHSVELV